MQLQFPRKLPTFHVDRQMEYKESPGILDIDTHVNNTSHFQRDTQNNTSHLQGSRR